MARGRKLGVRKIAVPAIVLTLFAAFLAGALALTAQPAPEHPFFRLPRPTIVAHRGGRSLGPENTLHTFRKALEAGAHVLEMDVRATRDGIPVLMHDATVDRTTDGRGAVRDLSFRDIRKLDAAYRWSPDGGATFPLRGRGIAVPALEEVLKAFAEAPKSIEIKGSDPATATLFCELVRRYDHGSRILASSFHDETVEAVRRSCPQAATSVTFSEGRWLFLLSRLRLTFLHSPEAHALQVPERFGRIQVVTPRFVRDAHGRNLRVYVWTVNDPRAMRALLDMGVDGLITDHPRRMRRLGSAESP